MTGDLTQPLQQLFQEIRQLIDAAKLRATFKLNSWTVKEKIAIARRRLPY
jgi:uncharacterized protein (DUF111 family)